MWFIFGAVQRLIQHFHADAWEAPGEGLHMDQLQQLAMAEQDQQQQMDDHHMGHHMDDHVDHHTNHGMGMDPFA